MKKNLSTSNEIHVKCVCIDGSVLNGVRQPKLFLFVLDKPPGYEVFCEPETIHYKKINKNILNTMRVRSENHNHEEIVFNQETTTFTLQMIKI